jgi:hypothetical protein
MAELCINLPRGDIRHVKFKVLSGGEEFTELDEIYFTVKSNTKTEKIIFQKKLSSGDIVLGEDGFYHFTIYDTDTDDLSYGVYRFDIEIVGDEIKQTKLGTLELTEEVTFAANEGA